MTLNTFADVTRLDATTQTALLHDGAPIEQVWAAWALALERGKEAVPTLVTELDQITEAGARHFVLVVLAGLGEHALLLTLAERDPDDLVRATACQYSLRCCAPADRATLRAIAHRLMCDPSPYVRQAILQEAPHILFSLTPADRDTLIAHPSVAVRQAMLDALHHIGLATPALLDAWLAVEEDGTVRRQLLRLHVEIGGALPVLRTAYAAPLTHARAVLDVLIAYGCTFDVATLAPLEARADYAIDVALVSLLDTADADARLWLLWRIARTYNRDDERIESEMTAAAVAARLAPLYTLRRADLLRKVRAARRLWRGSNGSIATTLPIQAITRYTGS